MLHHLKENWCNGSMITTMKQAKVEVQNTLATLVVVINNTNSEIQAKQLQRKRIKMQKVASMLCPALYWNHILCLLKLNPDFKSQGHKSYWKHESFIIVLAQNGSIHTQPKVKRVTKDHWWLGILEKLIYVCNNLILNLSSVSFPIKDALN